MRIGLGFKLSFIIGALVAASLVSVTLLGSHFIGEDVRITAQNNNLTINSRSAAIVSDKLSTVCSNAFQLLSIATTLTGSANVSLSRQLRVSFFESNADIASICVLSLPGNKNTDDVRMINQQFLIDNETSEDAIDNALAANENALERACNGETVAVNASPYFGFPAMMLYFPWQGNGEVQGAVITLSTEGLSDMLGSGTINNTFMVNDDGDLLSYTDTDRLVAGDNVRHHPLVKQGLEATDTGGGQQTLFTTYNEDRKEVKFYGAWQRINTANIAVFTMVPLATVTEAVDQTRRNNFYLTGLIMFISMAFILIYAKTGITRHLRRLTQAAEEIQKGNFDTHIISKLNTKRRDEIGMLNLSTQKEQTFLNTFSRFTNKAVAKSIAAGTLDFAPHLKDLAIFFSDIRGFTSISDGFKDKFGDNSPREIISFLNDYMARMVRCVTLSGGNIDKFEGDAIMGVWGILREDDLYFEGRPHDVPGVAEAAEEHHKHVLEDAINCVRGVIAMRYSLMKYNKDAEIYTREHSDGTGSYKPHIRIGCGINTGRATAGIMGSEYKMEYTAIGDAVNFASRTESSNKLCGTDILITEDTYTLLKLDYIRCKENNYTLADECLKDEIVVEMIPVAFEVKGKGAQHFYGVVNMPHFDIEAFFRQGDENFTPDADCIKAVGPTGPKTLNDVRRMLGIAIPNFSKVNLNAEENKITVAKSK